MSWTGENKKAINSALAALNHTGEPSDAVRVVSAYYSGVSTKFKLWRKAPLRLDHIFWALVWRYEAVRYAEKITGTFLFRIDIGGTINMPTADDVDVLCAVFWRFGNRHQKENARRLLVYASKIPEKHAYQHTIAFIALHKVRYGLDEWSDALHNSVLKMAISIAEYAGASSDQSAKLAGYGQASRVFRQLAEMLPKHDQRRADYMNRAKLCAEAGSVTDQVLKAE